MQRDRADDSPVLEERELMGAMQTGARDERASVIFGVGPRIGDPMLDLQIVAPGSFRPPGGCLTSARPRCPGV